MRGHRKREHEGEEIRQAKTVEVGAEGSERERETEREYYRE